MRLFKLLKKQKSQTATSYDERYKLATAIEYIYMKPIMTAGADRLPNSTVRKLRILSKAVWD